MLPFLTLLPRKFEHTLEGLGWPKPLNPPLAPGAEGKLAKWRRMFRDLLQLEKPPTRTHESINEEGPGKKDTVTLLPIQCMLKPVILRFRFHFMGKRPTNRRDKPEWYLTDVLNSLRDHEWLLRTEAQRILLASGQPQIDAYQVFVQGLLDVVKEKMQQDAPMVLEQGPLLAHTLSEALIFDVTLREEGLWMGTMGVAEVYLSKEERFQKWLTVERECKSLSNSLSLSPYGVIDPFPGLTLTLSSFLLSRFDGAV